MNLMSICESCYCNSHSNKISLMNRLLHVVRFVRMIAASAEERLVLSEFSARLSRGWLGMDSFCLGSGFTVHRAP